jgi:multiple sugar transport system ATP-binding protein
MRLCIRVESYKFRIVHVDVVEPAGADTYVLMTLGGVEVTARLQAETAAQSGTNMEFTFNMAKASYFDANTGERLN